ncbi:MAG: hypothetical protein IKF78_03805 [Atopobiaceae bacterium]|nr:hypothetical protein [Atopobiaceae bacterium]
MGIDLRIIPDLDILNERAKIRNLYESCGGDWSEIESDYNVLSRYFESQDKKMPKREDVRRMLDAYNGERLDKREIKSLRTLISCKSAWSKLKDMGLDAVRGDQRMNLDALMIRLRGRGIYPVPCGELEHFVPDAGGHATDWLSAVLERHPDLDDSAYRSAKEFIESWGI